MWYLLTNSNVTSQLEKAAPVLARLKQPIVVAKVDADKYRKLASKHDIEYVIVILRGNFFIKHTSWHLICRKGTFCLFTVKNIYTNFYAKYTSFCSFNNAFNTKISANTMCNNNQKLVSLCVLNIRAGRFDRFSYFVVHSSMLACVDT